MVKIEIAALTPHSAHRRFLFVKLNNKVTRISKRLVAKTPKA